MLKIKYRSLILSLAILLLWIFSALYVWHNFLSPAASQPKNFSKLTLNAFDLAQAEKYISEIMAECYKNSESQCYQQASKLFLNKYGLKNILDVFEKNEQQEVFFSKCHLTSHYLGQEAFVRQPDVRKIFTQSTRACLGGAYHGTVEGYFISKNILFNVENSENIAREIPKICGKSEEYTIKQEFIECNHGMGHGLMFLTENDLLKALELCDFLPENLQKELCYTGAFMANADGTSSTDHPSIYAKVNDPLYPCKIVKKPYQHACYTYGVLSAVQADLDKSISTCLEIPAEFQNGCFQTFGRDRTMLSSDPTELYAQCLKIQQKNFQADCVSGVAYNLFVRFGLNSDLPAKFCQIVANELKTTCYVQFYRVNKNLSSEPNALEKICGSLPEPAYKNICLGIQE